MILNSILNFLKKLTVSNSLSSTVDIKEENISKNNLISKETKNARTYLDYDWTSVIQFETGGKNYYEKFLKKATWPGGQSGITIGVGADLGYMSLKEFEAFFSMYFSEKENDLLKSVIGIKGEKARNVLLKVKHIELSWENACKAFVEWTLPKFWKTANDVWPGLDELKEDAQIALVSIVFNRGSSVVGSSRAEMRNIKELVTKKDYKGIAEQIRLMKRLWINKNLDGLLSRREKEAKAVEGCS